MFLFDRFLCRKVSDRVEDSLRHKKLCQPELLAIGNRTETPGCLVEQTVNAALGEAFDEAEALLFRRFGEISLVALSADFHTRLAERGVSPALENTHAA